MNKTKAVWLVLIIVVIAAAAVLAASFILPQLGKSPSTNLPVNTNTGESTNNQPVALASEFATYKETPVNITPKVAAYAVNPKLDNVTNGGDFNLSPAAKELLVKNGFVVVPSAEKEFFSLYESNRYGQIPSFVTTDSILHNYHLMFDHSLRNLETENLIPELKKLNADMLSAALADYNALKGTVWENAAKREVGFFAVGGKLLDANIQVPGVVSDLVNQELALIEAHAGIAPSPVMNLGESAGTVIQTPQGPLPLEALKEDYSQYIPRGHYNTDELKAYFKTMMWYGRLTFRLKNEDEVRSAILITLALGDKDAGQSWNKIYEPINFFVGKSDDINYFQFKIILDQIYGANATLKTIENSQDKFASFIAAAKKLEPPQINSIPIFQASLQPDRAKEITGFRFMGQRFTIDASIFQRLIVRETGPKGDSCANAPFSDGRMLPKALDIPAAMGSAEALKLITAEGDTAYACYPENMAKMKNYLSGLDEGIWTQNLYWGWLYSLLPITSLKGAGYPPFMQNQAWQRKDLNTYLGSWTELKHDTILYAKQVYAELGGGPSEEKDYRGYVEPDPYVYARLASLLQMTSGGLEARGILSQQNKDDFGKMADLALSLKVISEKELNNESLSDTEYELIKSYGGQLEHFWISALEDEGVVSPSQLDDKPAALVADVATDPNGQVLEEGTGNIFYIYVVVPIDGKLRIAKGGVYSHYEFAWPLSDRLTDEAWRTMLDAGQAPALPDWTNLFIAK